MRPGKRSDPDQQRGVGAALSTAYPPVRDALDTIYPPERAAQAEFDRLLERMKQKGSPTV